MCFIRPSECMLRYIENKFRYVQYNASFFFQHSDVLIPQAIPSFFTTGENKLDEDPNEHNRSVNSMKTL